MIVVIHLNKKYNIIKKSKEIYVKIAWRKKIANGEVGGNEEASFAGRFYRENPSELKQESSKLVKPLPDKKES